MSDPASSEEDPLRPEYDFSRAVRGRHGERFNISEPAGPPEWYRQAVFVDRQVWLSEALQQVQRLEGLLVTYLCLVFGVEPERAGESVMTGAAAGDGGLQRILADLGSGMEGGDGDLECDVAGALRDRDWVVHKSLQQHASGDIESTRKLVARLQGAAKSLAAACDVIQRLMRTRVRKAGMTDEDYERRSKEVLRRWLAA